MKKQYINIMTNKTPKLTHDEKVQRIINKAREMGIKLGGNDGIQDTDKEQ